MPAPVLHLGATVLCTHAGQATPTRAVPARDGVRAAVVTLASPYAVARLRADRHAAPPCVTGAVDRGAARVLAGGAPVAMMTGQSICVPTGTPMLPVVAQTRVLAT